MGIFLNFSLAPTRISPYDWEKTYEDALKIADKCGLLDKIFSERNGVKYVFARKTAERIVYGQGAGICVYGTMNSGYNMEDFALFRSLDYYRKELGEGDGAEDNGADILFTGWYTGESDDDFIPVPNQAGNIWGGKTQGKPGHIPLLAVACLFADRFPDAVTVGGDITAGQCNAAVRLVRECLGIDIQPPVRCRPDVLARRIHAAAIPEQVQLRAFFKLYLGSLTEKVGDVLREVFGEDALYRYFRAQFVENQKEGYQHSSDIRDYLLLHLDFSGLLKMMVSDEEGCQMSLETALSDLFSHNIHVPMEEKNCDSPVPSTAENGDSESVSSIYGLLGGAFLTMFAGRNKNLPVYIPLEEIRTACREIDRNSDELIDRLLREQVPDERQEKVYGNREDSIIEQMRRTVDEDMAREKEKEVYDISSLSDLFEYRPEATFEPKFEESLLGCLRQVQGFDKNGESFKEFLSMNCEQRENWFLRQNRYVLFQETMWNHIFEHIMEDDYIRRYFLLFLVDCSQKSGSDLLEPLMSSPKLVDRLWEKALIEPTEGSDD